jgi:hypothetical protein
VLASAQSLATEGNRLKLEVAKFLNLVRAASPNGAAQAAPSGMPNGVFE